MEKLKREKDSMEKKDLIKIDITDMAEDGSGIGHTEDGMAVFVNGAVFGDKVLAEITKAKKNFAFADAVEIIEKSPHREDEERVCPYIDECGGCAFGNLKYETQLELKSRHVEDKLKRIAGIETPNIMPIVGMDYGNEPWPLHYRNKAVVAVYQDSNGTPYVGFRGRKSHRVIDCDYCMIQAPTANAAVRVLREYLRGNKAPITQMTVKTAFGTGEVMVILHVNGKGELPDLENLCYELEDAIDAAGYSLESVVIDREYVVKEGGKKGPVKTFNKSRLEFVAGKRTIKDKLMGLEFEISPRAFYQVNPAQTEKLYSKVLEYLGVESAISCESSDQQPNMSSNQEAISDMRDTVLDLYCGIGTIGTLVAKSFDGEVLGIESVKEAVIDANRNAVINGVVNERFICGKAEEELPELVDSIGEVYAVVLDPPRAGCHEELLKAVTRISPERIIYVSCNPATLARDIKFLSEFGYEMTEATPVDMFCHSSHVETVCCLHRIGS